MKSINRKIIVKMLHYFYQIDRTLYCNKDNTDKLWRTFQKSKTNNFAIYYANKDQ